MSDLHKRKRALKDAYIARQKYRAKFYTPPPCNLEKTLLGVGQRGGAYKIPAAGGFKIYNPPPSLRHAFWPKNMGEAGDLISPWKKTCLFGEKNPSLCVPYLKWTTTTTTRTPSSRPQATLQTCLKNHQTKGAENRSIPPNPFQYSWEEVSLRKPAVCFQTSAFGVRSLSLSISLSIPLLLSLSFSLYLSVYRYIHVDICCRVNIWSKFSWVNIWFFFSKDPLLSGRRMRVCKKRPKLCLKLTQYSCDNIWSDYVVQHNWTRNDSTFAR